MLIKLNRIFNRGEITINTDHILFMKEGNDVDGNKHTIIEVNNSNAEIKVIENQDMIINALEAWYKI